MNKLIDSAGLVQIRNWVNNKLTSKIGILNLGSVNPGDIPINDLFSRMLELFGNLDEGTGNYSAAGIVTCSGYLNFYGFVAMRYVGAFEITILDLKTGKFFYDYRDSGESFVSIVTYGAKKLITEDMLDNYAQVIDLTKATKTGARINQEGEDEL